MFEEEVDYEIYWIEREIKISNILQELTSVCLAYYVATLKPKVLQMSDIQLDECHEIVLEIQNITKGLDDPRRLGPLFTRLDALL